MDFKRLLVLFGLAGLLVGQSGCAVPQRPGKGSVSRHIESKMKAEYWLYLPEDYVKCNGQRPDHKPWPLVVTFHGTKPFDDAHPQVREWQEEADRYGLIVVAPELHTCDCFMQFPLRDPTLPYVQRDDRATLAIMDEVVQRNHADPTRVLSTGWSSGGYLAHFVVNRHPDRFSCLAVREATFSESMLNAAQTSKYHDMKVGIFFGGDDIAVCQHDGREAIAWYRNHGFTVEAKSVVGAGHVRIPQTAAAFFASTLGLAAKTPSDLADYSIKDVLTDSNR